MCVSNVYIILCITFDDRHVHVINPTSPSNVVAPLHPEIESPPDEPEHPSES